MISEKLRCPPGTQMRSSDSECRSCARIADRSTLVGSITLPHARSHTHTCTHACTHARTRKYHQQTDGIVCSNQRVGVSIYSDAEQTFGGWLCNRCEMNDVFNISSASVNTSLPVCSLNSCARPAVHTLCCSAFGGQFTHFENEL